MQHIVMMMGHVVTNDITPLLEPLFVSGLLALPLEALLRLCSFPPESPLQRSRTILG